MNIEIIRSNRKTLTIEVKSGPEVIARAPYRMPEVEIRRFIEQKSSWIERSIEKIRMQQDSRDAQPKLSLEEIQNLADQALEVLPGKAAYYAKLVGVTYHRITIRNQKSRWGSCSSKGNLNFNCLLMLTPKEVQDYVVVHELCHRKEMNHSQNFWAEVKKVLPEYKKAENWLKANGGTIISRMIQ